MKKFRNSMTLTGLVLAFILASCVAWTPPINTPNSIASLEKVKLGGIDQWILIRGTDRSNPVLLFLHGGPGSPEMPMEHYFGTELEKHFVVVHWDQRGAGKSLSAKIPRESMNIKQFISDARELTQLLKKRFSGEKIYLMGHSWGSLLGVKVVQKYPQDYYAYIGIGQVVDMQRNEAISYQFVLEEAKKRKDAIALRQLKQIGPPPYKNIIDLGIQREYLRKFGGAVYQKETYNKFKNMIYRAPEYAGMDTLKYLYGNVYGPALMWNELMTVNFLETAPRLEVPVYFLEGRHDYNTPWELVQEYYDKLDAPKGKTLIWFENSAHSPNLEEPERFSEAMVDQVLKDTYPEK